MSKERIFSVLRWLCVLALIVFIATRFQSQSISDANIDEVAAAATSKMDMTNLQVGDNQMIKRLYSLSPADYEGCVLYYPMTNMEAEELFIVKLSDIAQQESVVAALQARVETQKNTFDGYGFEQYDLLTNHCIIRAEGNFVLFVVGADADAVLDAFLDAL